MQDNILSNVRSKGVKIHCITNYVTARDCANILLAVGAFPIMADDEAESAQITANCQGLVINTGTLSNARFSAMIKSGVQANKNNLITVLDPVGVTASDFRKNAAARLLKDVKFSVIRGNSSEIKALNQDETDFCGVDSTGEESLEALIHSAQSLSKKTGAIVVVSGKTDIVCNDKRTYLIANGTPYMSKITGTGCQLSCIIAAFAAANPQNLQEAVAAAVGFMGIAGELAQQKAFGKGGGLGSMAVAMTDYVSVLTDSQLKEKINFEYR